MARLRGCVVLLLCLLSVVHSVRAQDPAPVENAPANETPAEKKRRASEHFERGVMLYGDGAHRAALIEFERAYQTLPDYRLLYNIAHVRMLVEDYLGAARDYEEYLEKGRGKLPADRVEAVKRELDILRERIGHIAVRVTKPNAKVFIDDVLIGQSPIQKPVRMNVGRHKVFAQMKDGAVATSMVDLAGGELQHVTLDPKIPPKPGLVAPGTRLFWPVATTIGAGVFAGATIATGVYERKYESDLEDRTRRVPANPRGIEQTRDRAKALAISTDVLGATAIGLTAVTLWLWLRDPPKDDKQPKAEKKTAWNFNLGLTGASASREF